MDRLFHLKRASLIFGVLALAAVGCGGGTGTGGTFGSAETLAFEGWEAYKDASFEEAEKLFNSALTLDPTFSEAYNGLGWLNFKEAGLEKDSERRRRFLDAAKENFERAVASDDESADAWAGLAGLELALGNWVQASSSALKTLESDPSYFSPHDNIDWEDIRMLWAQALVHQGKFFSPSASDPDSAVNQIEFIDRGFRQEYIDDELTEADIIRKIEELQGL